MSSPVSKKRAVDLESWVLRSTATAFALPGKEEKMKRLIAMLALCLTVSVPSFGAQHVVSHSAKVAANDSYKAAKYSAKATDKVVKSSVKGTSKVFKTLF